MTTFRTRFTFRVDTWTPDGESIVEHMGGPGRATIGQPNLKARRRRVVLTMIGIVEVAALATSLARQRAVGFCQRAG